MKLLMRNFAFFFLYSLKSYVHFAHRIQLSLDKPQVEGLRPHIASGYCIGKCRSEFQIQCEVSQKAGSSCYFSQETTSDPTVSTATSHPLNPLHHPDCRLAEVSRQGWRAARAHGEAEDRCHCELQEEEAGGRFSVPVELRSPCICPRVCLP